MKSKIKVQNIEKQSLSSDSWPLLLLSHQAQPIQPTASKPIAWLTMVFKDKQQPKCQIAMLLHLLFFFYFSLSKKWILILRFFREQEWKEKWQSIFLRMPTGFNLTSGTPQCPLNSTEWHCQVWSPNKQKFVSSGDVFLKSHLEDSYMNNIPKCGQNHLVDFKRE